MVIYQTGEGIFYVATERPELSKVEGLLQVSRSVNRLPLLTMNRYENILLFMHEGLGKKEINKHLEHYFPTLLTKLNLSIENIFDNNGRNNYS
jgi:hypothetical protein